ncbi:MAG: hypothetical protein ACKVS8_08855 [Phycisphaerales bacterium]
MTIDNRITIKHPGFRLNLNQFRVNDLPAATITIVGTSRDAGSEIPSGMFTGTLGHGQFPSLLALITDAALILHPELAPEVEALRTRMKRFLLP